MIVEGRLKQHSYTTQDGQNRRITDIHVEKIQSLETTNKADNNSYNDSNNSNQQSNYNQNNNETAQNNRPEPDFINDDVPF